jgi:hypothetical protein
MGYYLDWQEPLIQFGLGFNRWGFNELKGNSIGKKEIKNKKRRFSSKDDS